MKLYEINEVAQLTGLAAARLRAWERRYDAVRPRRMPNGYRVYTSDQVALLRAFAQLIGTGERIGDLAGCPRDEVLARAELRRPDDTTGGALLAAIRALDRERLETLVAEQLTLRGLRRFAEEVALPLARTIGAQWSAGELPIVAEHLASEVVVHALKGALRIGRRGAPLLLAACIPGERHEWGLLCTMSALQDQGWSIHYLGADLPIEQVAEAAWTLTPRAIALSGSDQALVRASLPALAALPVTLPPDTIAVIGGSGVDRHAPALHNYGIRTGPGALAVAP